ncbi:MAG TPA: hypothetical protein VJ761_16405 [Ktedonobacteraceae bacterium]|nr:hypothetical protein [Ktedonobacteraceae bacterium]
MNDVTKYEAFEACGELKQLFVSSQRTFPRAPFPRQCVHCVMNDLANVVQAVHALWADGFKATDTHVMASWDFVEAVERNQQRRGSFSSLLRRILSFLDEGLGEAYLDEARRGNHILAVRLSCIEQLHRVHDLLILHNARLIKYVDTWTVTDLAPAREYVAGPV